MTESAHNELVYYAAYSLLKSLYHKGEITKEVFERLNKMNAEKMNCKECLL